MDDLNQLVERGPGLWTTSRPLALMGVPFGRRMMVVRHPDEDTLMLQSPFLPEKSVAQKIEQLGPVETIVVPTRFHDTFLDDVVAAYPSASYYLAPGLPLPAEVAKPVRGIEAMDERWAGVLQRCEVGGMPKVRESVFLHRPSRSLLVGDLIFNPGRPAGFWSRSFFRMIGVLDRSGPSRLFRMLIKDRTAFAQSIQTIASWEYDRLVPSHFSVLEGTAAQGALERLSSQYADL